MSRPITPGSVLAVQTVRALADKHGRADERVVRERLVRARGRVYADAAIEFAVMWRELGRHEGHLVVMRPRGESA